MFIRSAIFLATFGTKFHLKPTCNLEENPTQTRDIMSKLPSFRFENHGPFAKYQLSDGSSLVSMVSIDENVKFPLMIFLKSI
jgi:hypothetical protein